MRTNVFVNAAALLSALVSSAPWPGKDFNINDHIPPVSNIPQNGPAKAMNSIPVPRDTWEPRNTVKTSYGALNNVSSQVFALANLELNTTRPSIRLDNFLDIVKIECPDVSTMYLVFTSESHATLAYNAWSTVPDMGIIVGHEKGCNGNNVGSFTLVNVLDISGKEMLLQVNQVKRQEIVSDWAVSVTHYSIERQSHISKRDFAKNMTIPLNFNLDAAMKSIGDPFFWFLGCQYVMCWNCYTKGQAQVQIDFRGRFLHLHSYKMRVVGNFEASLNLKLSAVPQDETYLWWNYITMIPLTPFDVPGVFVLGPGFRVMGAIVVYADTEVSATIGFDVKMPFDHEISSNDMKTPAAYKNNHKTNFTYHPLNLIVFDPKPTYIGGHVMLAPEIGVGIQLFDTKLADVAIRIQNQIGFIHRYGNLTKCAGEKPSTEIFHRHKFQHVISPAPLISLIYTDYDSAMIPITCIDCHSCPADSSLFTNSTQHLNATAVALDTKRDLVFANVTNRFSHLIDSK